MFAGFVEIFFGHFRPEIRYGALPRGSQNLHKTLPIYSSSIRHKPFDSPCPAAIYNLTKSPTAKSLTGILQWIRSAPQTQLSKVWLKTWKRFHGDGKCPLDGIWCQKQLSILIQGRNYARGNRQIIRISREYASISAGAPWLWRSVMQIDKVSQEPARLRMLTVPFHGTFFFHWKFIVGPVLYLSECPGEPVVWFFLERSDFFRTSIVERLVVILKTTLSPQHMFFVVFNVLLIRKTTFNAHNN